jgi:hypothetical protein
MRATTPLRIKGNDAIVMRTKTRSPQQQGCRCIDNGNNAIVIRANIAIATMAKNPAHQWQQCHHNVGDDTSLMTSGEGNSASSTTAETSLHINNGNDTIMMRATFAITTPANMPAHQRR